MTGDFSSAEYWAYMFENQVCEAQFHLYLATCRLFKEI